MMKGLSRVEWVLGILLVVLLGVVMVLALLIWFQPGPVNTAVPQNSATTIAMHADDIAPTPETPGQTARVAYASAQQAARNWQTDAILLNASAAWPQGADELLLSNGQSEWRYTFFSKQAGEAAFITVNENQPQLLSTSRYTQAETPVATTAWNIDSIDAVQIFMNAGGREFMRQEGVTLFNMFLTADNVSGNGRIEWNVSLVSPQSSKALELQIDATNGDIIPNP